MGGGFVRASRLCLETPLRTKPSALLVSVCYVYCARVYTGCRGEYFERMNISINSLN